MREQYLRKIKQYFTRHKHVVAVYLYGSLGKNKLRQDSDIDIAILHDIQRDRKKLTEIKITYHLELSEMLQKNTDILLLRTASPFMKYLVFKEGITVIERDRTVVTDFKAKSIIEYLDFKILEDSFFKKMKKNIEEKIDG